MLLNNDVNMNNLMMLWGELNVLMKKCNYQSKGHIALRKSNAYNNSITMNVDN